MSDCISDFSIQGNCFAEGLIIHQQIKAGGFHNLSVILETANTRRLFIYANCISRERIMFSSNYDIIQSDCYINVVENQFVTIGVVAMPKVSLSSFSTAFPSESIVAGMYFSKLTIHLS